MRVLIAVRATSLKVLLLLQAASLIFGKECGQKGFVCVGSSQVQQCVDGTPMGPVADCGPGFLCDNEAKWGPCVDLPKDACCDEGLFPVKGSCHLFMSCINDGLDLVQFFGSCAPGFAFYPQLSRCYPEKSTLGSPCVTDIDTPEPNANQTTPTTTTTTPAPITDSITDCEDVTTTQVVTTPAKPKKPVCSSPGHYPDPASCRHYYSCSWATGGGVKSARVQCAQNLLFDSRMRQCVYSASCGTRPRN